MTDAAALSSLTPGRRALMTGATGRVGHAVLVALVELGHRPRALLLPHVRSLTRSQGHCRQPDVPRYGEALDRYCPAGR